jgi:hypothetical protein
MCMWRKLTWTLTSPPPQPSDVTWDVHVLNEICVFSKTAKTLARFSPRWHKLVIATTIEKASCKCCKLRGVAAGGVTFYIFACGFNMFQCRLFCNILSLFSIYSPLMSSPKTLGPWSSDVLQPWGRQSGLFLCTAHGPKMSKVLRG